MNLYIYIYMYTYGVLTVCSTPNSDGFFPISWTQLREEPALSVIRHPLLVVNYPLSRNKHAKSAGTILVVDLES